MRRGDPINAKSSKTWTGSNQPFRTPSYTNLSITQLSPASTSPGTFSVQPTLDAQLKYRGDFNTGNGGAYFRNQRDNVKA